MVLYFRLCYSNISDLLKCTQILGAVKAIPSVWWLCDGMFGGKSNEWTFPFIICYFNYFSPTDFCLACFKFRAENKLHWISGTSVSLLHLTFDIFRAIFEGFFFFSPSNEVHALQIQRMLFCKVIWAFGRKLSYPSKSSMFTKVSVLAKSVRKVGGRAGPGDGVLKYELWLLKQIIWCAHCCLLWKWEVAPAIELSSGQAMVAYCFGLHAKNCRDFWSLYMGTSEIILSCQTGAFLKGLL